MIQPPAAAAPPPAPYGMVSDFLGVAALVFLVFCCFPKLSSFRRFLPLLFLFLSLFLSLTFSLSLSLSLSPSLSLLSPFGGGQPGLDHI